MKNLELIFSILFVLGGLAFVVALIKYPKDFVKLVWAFITFPFRHAWDLIKMLFSPIWLVLVIIDEITGLKILSDFTSKSLATGYKTSSKKQINFSKFKKYIFINSTKVQSIKEQLVESYDTCPEVNIEGYTIIKTDKYSIIELPNSGFYGFNFLLMWLKENLHDTDVYGYATNKRSKFFIYVDPNTDNNLIGRTNKQQKFWVSMYEDLDTHQFLRINLRVRIDTNLTTDFFEQLLNEKAI